MKCRFIQLLIFVIVTSNVYADNKDSLIVTLYKTDSLFFVDLVFENISSDSMLIPAKFKNFYLEWEQGIGIKIYTYINKNPFVVNLGEMYDSQYFKFSENKYIFIPPKSKMRYNFDLSRYFNKLVSDAEYGVRFAVNYIFIKRDGNKDTLPKIVRFTTNYVIIKEKMKHP